MDKRADPHLGREIAGKFVLQEVIGVGAMGRVYKAHNTALDKIVAVKVLTAPDGARDANHAARFKAEARAASRLDHENSVHIFDFGTDGPDQLMYIAMEFLQGQNLGEVLKRTGKLSVLRSCHIIVQVLGALAAAHRNGVVHRDLKPANIMLVKKRGDEGEVSDFVKVCDFGIAKVMEVGDPDDATAMTMTKQGAIFGTPAYMSPEQARGAKVDFRTDIYSSGVILYRMIAGKTPFSAETAMGLMTKLTTEEAPPLSRHVSTIDPRLEAIVHKAMSKDRQARFPSAQEMRAAIKETMEGAAPPAPPAPAIGEQTPPAARDTFMVLPRVTLSESTAPPPPPAAPAPFQTLTGSAWANRSVRPPPAAVEPKSSLKIPLVIVLVLGLLVAAGIGVKRWMDDRGAVSRLIELTKAGSYGVAENVFHEHFEALKHDERALALVPEILRMRREQEGEKATFGVVFDPGYTLAPSSWDTTYRIKEMKRTQRFYTVFERVETHVIEGYLDYPDSGVRAAIRGIRHGNHLVFWDWRVLIGPTKDYILDDKKNVLIEGDKFVGTDGPFQANLSAVFQKKL